MGGPLRFEFKVPKIPRTGQHVRAAVEPRRKSPPPREVGPRVEAPEDEKDENEEENAEENDEQGSQGRTGSQGGE